MDDMKGFEETLAICIKCYTHMPRTDCVMAARDITRALSAKYRISVRPYLEEGAPGTSPAQSYASSVDSLIPQIESLVGTLQGFILNRPAVNDDPMVKGAAHA